MELDGVILKLFVQLVEELRTFSRDSDKVVANDLEKDSDVNELTVFVGVCVAEQLKLLDTET